MHNLRPYHFAKIFIAAVFYLLTTIPFIASAANVTLQWDANEPTVEGYRLYQRVAGQDYNYDLPVWTGAATSCTIGELNDGTTYYFIVRAYIGSNESGDSNEAEYSPEALIPNPSLDSDDDGVIDGLDAFPQDPTEWLDTDGDGIGNNADLDDDGDSMPDAWELLYDLNPLVDDADLDRDGDGISNVAEYLSGSNPSLVPGNTVPQTPVLIHPSDGAENVDLTPVLIIDSFTDADSDTHASTSYQISTTDDFTALVYERTFSSQLIQNRIIELVLDPETTYYWRAKVIDGRNGASEWSEPFSFTTQSCEAVGDSDCDGILDHQELEDGVDLDGDGTSDQAQTGLRGVYAEDTLNPRVAVKRLSTNVQIVSMQALNSDTFFAESNPFDRITGLISFKLHILDDATTASVVVYFSQRAPDNASWYKYDPDQGWQVYPYARFAADRMSVTITLEDGGTGDDDGVRNGIIVDPSGLGFSSSQRPDDSSSSVEPETGAGSGCFIGITSGQTVSHANRARGTTVCWWLLGIFIPALCAIIRPDAIP